MSDTSRCWQEGFIQLFYSSLWKNFNQSFFKNYCKTTHRFGQTSQGTPWILFISLRNETFRKSRCLYSFFVTKKLTPMAVVYQVRYPSVSGTGADWRNLELSPLPLSNDQYILNERRYHQPRELRHWATVKGTKLHIYPKLNRSNLICGLNLKYCTCSKQNLQLNFEEKEHKQDLFTECVYSKTRGHTYTWPTRGPPQACYSKYRNEGNIDDI